jgi:hypothetical protein
MSEPTLVEYPTQPPPEVGTLSSESPPRAQQEDAANAPVEENSKSNENGTNKLQKRLIRKRVLDSDDDSDDDGTGLRPEEGAAEAPAPPEEAAAAAADDDDDDDDSVSFKERKRLKKSKKNRHKKLKKSKKHKKLKRNVPDADGSSSEAGDRGGSSSDNDSDDDHKMKDDEAEAEVAPDDDDALLSSVDEEDDEDNDRDEIAEEALKKIDSEVTIASAVASSARLGEPEAAAVEDVTLRPDDDAQFEALVKPIILCEEKDAIGRPGTLLCAVPFYVVEMELDNMGAMIREKTVPSDENFVRQEIERIRKNPHACGAHSSFASLVETCGKRFSERDILKWRRTPLVRQAKTLRRAWLMMTMSQTNGAADTEDYSCAIGVYRLVMKTASIKAFGVSGGDLAAAACDALVEPRPLYPHEVARIVNTRALCLTRHELKLCEFRPREMALFLNRTTRDPNTCTSSVALTCFGGMPVKECAMAGLTCITVCPSRSRLICEIMPVNFEADTTRLRKMAASETTESVAAADALRKLVSIQPVYNIPRIKTLISGLYFHPTFYRANNFGRSNISLINTNHPSVNAAAKAAASAKRAAGEADEDAEASLEAEAATAKKATAAALAVSDCIEWANCPDLSALCASINSGTDISKRMTNALKAMFTVSSRRSGKVEPELSFEVVDTAICRLYSATRETDEEARTKLHQFVELFGDLYIDEDPDLNVLTRAFGIALGRALVTVGFTRTVSTHIMRTMSPYTVYFMRYFQNARGYFGRSLRASFMQWMKTERPDAYADLMHKAGNNDERAIDVIERVADAVSRLELARLAHDRCAVVPVGNVDAGTESVYMSIVNVPDSPVRIVGVGGALFVVETNDYVVETALRYVLLNAAINMKVGAIEALAERDVGARSEPVCNERIVLLRGATAEDMVHLIEAEIAPQYRDGIVTIDDETLGARLLVIVHDAFEIDQANFALSAMNVSQQCLVCTADSVCNLGSAGAGGRSWAQSYSAVLFYAAHRFSYDEMLRIVATLCGIDNVPPVPQRMTDKERADWRRSYIAAENRVPDWTCEPDMERERLALMREFCEAVVGNPTFDRLIEETPDRLWGTLSGNTLFGVNARFIFACVAYARPTVRSAIDLAPSGNFCDDLYFSNASDNMVRVEERAAEGTLGTWLFNYWTDNRLKFLPDHADVTNVAESKNIQKVLTEMYRDGMKANCPDEVARIEEQFRGVAKTLGRVLSSSAAVPNLKQSRLQFPVNSVNSSNLIAGWLLSGGTPMPDYVPSMLSAVRGVEVVPGVIFAATSMTTAFTDHATGLTRSRCSFLASGYGVGHSRMYDIGTHATRDPFLYETVQRHAPDVYGFGRAFMGEIIARLRTNLTAFVIVADTARRLCQQCLAPSTRISATRAPQLIAALRRDTALDGEAELLKRVNLDTDASIMRRRAAHAYHHCLQASSTFAWRREAAKFNEMYTQMVNGTTE